MNLWIVFLTGLFGGVSCMVLQGGLLASLVAAQKQQSAVSIGRITILFLFGKVIGYSVVGILLGVIGSVVPMTIQIRAGFMAVASVFLLITAFSIWGVPFFRFFSIRPSRLIYRQARDQSHQTNWIAAIVVGFLTIFLPCGTTQAMMVQALQFGNPLQSFLVMFVFTVGTIPIFVLLSVLLHVASVTLTTYFNRIAAFFLIILACWNISNVMAITGIDQPVKKSMRTAVCQVVYCDDLVSLSTVSVEPTTTPTITILANAYRIDTPYIPKGATITLHIINAQGAGCIQYFTIPSLGIQQLVPVGHDVTISFVAPQTAGDVPFMCSMGMYRGAFIVQ